ncbi:hypothetical protein PAHAL_2G304900 [Panicum hallii]|uniref:Uncharacterized protein n=1 Tax=Panicum hallii TaxID=206008 RepID=A0A2T8KR28_9POAL|nr:hypothetical protein PAHAL_2G304900 [Panicum hallii]
MEWRSARSSTARAPPDGARVADGTCAPSPRKEENPSPPRPWYPGGGGGGSANPIA